MSAFSDLPVDTMSKGRRKATRSDRHDRLLGTYGYDRGRYVGPDLDEDDVWPVADDDDDDDDTWKSPEPVLGLVQPDRSQSTHRVGRTDDRDFSCQLGGLSLAFDGDRTTDQPATVVHCRSWHHVASHAATSAPVNVPVWSRMVKVDDSPGSVDESEWVPPHEYLAREHGRSVTTSVFEGAGRTLKGRDASRVRDAVWSQTGFFG